MDDDRVAQIWFFYKTFSQSLWLLAYFVYICLLRWQFVKSSSRTGENLKTCSITAQNLNLSNYQLAECNVSATAPSDAVDAVRVP